MYKYSSAYGMAEGSQSILDWVQSRIDEAEYLTKKERGEITDPLREAMK
jgi:hypothetical protein